MKKINVVCGVLIQNEKVMIAQRKSGSSQGIFEFPGGKVEAGETLEQALIREWKEECGIQIENIQFLENNIDYQDGCEIHLSCFICTSKQTPKNPIVHTKFIWTTPEHIYDFPFFESDRILVNKLQEAWPCLKKPMK